MITGVKKITIALALHQKTLQQLSAKIREKFCQKTTFYNS